MKREKIHLHRSGTGSTECGRWRYNRRTGWPLKVALRIEGVTCEVCLGRVVTEARREIKRYQDRLFKVSQRFKIIGFPRRFRKEAGIDG